MRLLSGAESPDAGERIAGHQVVMQYFAQDEATRLEPALTVYETLAAGSPNQMVPAIRNILGGFLFSGDDVYKKAAVLSGGERTRLAVARMLLRPSNTLLLDEPTNHLDIDSKEVLLDALIDYGGTLIFVSHDRYFVDRLATKIIDVGQGRASLYPGGYEAFLWRQKELAAGGNGAPPASRPPGPVAASSHPRAAQARGGERQPCSGDGHQPRLRDQEARRCGTQKAGQVAQGARGTRRRPRGTHRRGRAGDQGARGPHGRFIRLCAT